LPLVWVVLNNCSLQIERELMLRVYGRETFCDYRKTTTKELWNPDLSKWAESMGALAFHVGKAEDYAPALRRALDARAPAVIEVDVAIDIEGYRSIWYPYPNNFYEPWAPGPGSATPPAASKS
jgi:acetolactate synthase-1/2/3 large subunit